MKQLWMAAGAAAWGAASRSGLRPFLAPSAQEAMESLCPGWQSVLVAAFPYYAGEEPGNLSLYCRGEDYHRVLLRRLTAVCRALQETFPDQHFFPGSDSSPVPELAAARLAGVGITGRSGLCIVPPYGSYIFLGTILTDLPPFCEADRGSPTCPPDCHACQSACPTGALGPQGCDPSRCLSALTQQKAPLSPREAAWVAASPTAWGCDLCQKACPYNRAPTATSLLEFRENLLASLSLSDLEGLSNKAFQRQYGHRAFAWRGIGPVRRTLELQHK